MIIFTRLEAAPPEITASAIDRPASAVWQQAAHRLPTGQALIYALVTGRWDGAR